jgi:RNA-directed DNA polymerase
MLAILSSWASSIAVRKAAAVTGPTLRTERRRRTCGSWTARCFAYVKNWVEKKVRRHLMRARNRAGCGWKRWSTVGLYEALGLSREYRVQYGART